MSSPLQVLVSLAARTFLIGLGLTLILFGIMLAHEFRAALPRTGGRKLTNGRWWLPPGLLILTGATAVTLAVVQRFIIP